MSAELGKVLFVEKIDHFGTGNRVVRVINPDGVDQRLLWATNRRAGVFENDRSWENRNRWQSRQLNQDYRSCTQSVHKAHEIYVISKMHQVSLDTNLDRFSPLDSSWFRRRKCRKTRRRRIRVGRWIAWAYSCPRWPRFERILPVSLKMWEERSVINGFNGIHNRINPLYLYTSSEKKANTFTSYMFIGV